MEEFDRSGLTAARFTRLAGLNYHTFMGWVRRRRLGGTGQEPRSEVAVGSVHFLEAAVGASGPTTTAMAAAGLEVELPGWRRVKIQAPDQLAPPAELIRLVAQSERARC